MLQTKTIISTLAALNDELTCTLTVLYHYFVNGKCQTDRNGRVSRVWVMFRVLDVRGRGLLQAEEDAALDTYINAVEHDIMSSKPCKIKNNFPKEECTALTKFRKRSDIVIKPAEKGSGTAIMDYSWYINECYRQLNDPN